MMKAQHVIWSNYDLDYERDWKGLLEEEYPDMTEEERELLMYEMNNSYLDDERCNPARLPDHCHRRFGIVAWSRIWLPGD